MPRQQQHGVFAPHFDKDETAAAVFEAEEEDRPHFDDRLVQNLTAIRGRDIDLTCKVYNLGNKTVRLLLLTMAANLISDTATTMLSCCTISQGSFTDMSKKAKVA